MQTPIKLESFSAVGAGQTANLVLAPGVTYDAVYIETNVPPAEIEQVKLELNANEIFALTGDELVMIDKYDEIYTAFAGPTYRYALPLQYET
ncbi:MAG: major capsid protein P2, partial [Natronospirillum sp.]